MYLVAGDWNEDYFDASNLRYLFLPNHAPALTETMRIEYTGAYTWTVSTTTISVTQTAHGLSVNDYIYKNEANVWVFTNSPMATHQVSAVGSVDTFTAKILASNIPEADFFPICNRAACLICFEISAKYSRTSDSTITLDSVSHTTRASEFRKAAKEFCGLYNSALGLGSGNGKGEGQYQPASEFVDFNTAPGYPGSRRWVFHNDERR